MSAARSLVRWIFELGPPAVLVALVWVKLVYLSVLVPSEWWANQETIGRWIRPTLGVVEAVGAYPVIAVATLATLMLLFAPLLLLPRERRFAVLLMLDFGLSLLGLADLMHVRFYGDVLSSSSFTTAGMIRDILPSLRDVFRPTDPLYVADVLLGILVLPAYARASRRLPPLGAATRGRLAGGLLVGGLLLAAPIVRLTWREEGGFISRSTPRIEVASTVGLLPYHLLELASGVVPRGAVGQTEVERVRQFLGRERGRQGPPSALFGSASGRNVIMISAESLQAFPIGLEVDGQPVMPRLAALSRESLYFTNFLDQTYLGTTSDAQFAALQSLHPQPVGFVAMNYAGNDFRALPGILSEHGYATLAAVGALGEFWNAERIHPRYGFQHSLFEPDFAPGERIGPWLSDEAFFAQMLPILETQAEPFMAFLFSSTHHHPYDLPERYRTLRVGALEGTLLGSYLQSAHHFDRALGQLVDGLRDSGLLDRSVLVIYGDHQGFLGDPPELASLLGMSEWGEYERLRVRKRVPLLVRLPGGAHADRRDITGGHLDIAPTVLSLLGIVDEGGVMLGRDLTRERESLVVFRDGSVTDGRHYVARRFGQAIGTACYEEASGRMVDCQPLEPLRREARERLEVSDLIVQGDLIPVLRGR